MIESSEVFFVGLATACVMAASAVATTKITGNQATKRQKADWDRQDEVAKRADERADILADRLLESNKQSARLAAKASGELITRVDEIHTLVNDRLTKALNGQLLALEGQLAVLLEITHPSAATLQHIENTQKQIRELREELKIRSDQQGQVEAKRAGGT
jgi:hypothetical protein